MSILNRIAYYQNRRDEIPNQELARELAQTRNAADIGEIAENLWNKETNVQSDCLKVLYELGYLAPDLVADYAGDFLDLLKSRNNRLVWGAMIALGTVADLKADVIFARLAEIRQAMDAGSVITVDNAVKTLALVASAKDEYRKAIFSILLEHLRTCRPKDVPQHAEKTLPAVDAQNKSEFIQALEKRLEDMLGSQVARVKKVIREAQKR
jgi:hypothetical protein